MTNRARNITATVLAVMIRPWLWPTVAAVLRRVRPDGGLIPPPEWRRFRAVTYGVETLADIPAGATIDYLRWCRRFPSNIR